MKISHLGNNIQTIRKFRGMKQQELADKIGITSIRQTAQENTI